MSEKRFEVGYFQVFAYPEEPELVPSWAAGIVRDGNMRPKYETNGS